MPRLDRFTECTECGAEVEGTVMRDDPEADYVDFPDECPECHAADYLPNYEPDYREDFHADG